MCTFSPTTKTFKIIFFSFQRECDTYKNKCRTQLSDNKRVCYCMIINKNV